MSAAPGSHGRHVSGTCRHIQNPLTGCDAGDVNQRLRRLSRQVAPMLVASLSFAIWKWVRYCEAALFDRLKDRVARTVSGLRVGRTDLLEIVCRPTPGQRANAPLFIENDLRRVLLKNSWRRTLRNQVPLTRTDRRLNRVLREIDEQLAWTEMRLAVFREQRATVHLIKGAIASARSERARTAQHWWTRNNEALTHFRDALAVPGNNKDLGLWSSKARVIGDEPANTDYDPGPSVEAHIARRRYVTCRGRHRWTPA